VNLWDNDAVSAFIQDGTWSEGYKESLEYCYLDWSRFQGFDFTPHHYNRTRKLPYVPTESELDSLIAGAKREYACYLQFLKESGWRPSEPLTLTPMDIQLEREIATLNAPKKGSNPRQIKLSKKLIAMITPIVYHTKSKDKLWYVSRHTIAKNFNRLKKRLSIKLGNQNLTKITLYTFRHWKATMEYHRTKDILYVKALLGHKNIKNTLVYTHLVDFKSDEWSCRVASTLNDAVELIEAGFE
jgi:integrase